MQENLKRPHEYRTASPRAFGLLLTVVLAVVALKPLLDRGAPRWWVMGLAGAALLLAGFVPSVYAMPNRVWARLGELLARVVSPVALVILFYGVFTPTGWLMRLARRNPLRLAYEPDAQSYWIEREPPGPDGLSLKNLF